jgi:hypothetical protein
MEEPHKNSNKILFLSKIPKASKSPDNLKSSKTKAQFKLTNFHNMQSSQISLNKSNMSVQKIFFNKKNYEQYMFQKNYLISKTQYNKIISSLSDIEIKLRENNALIDKYNNDLNNLKQTKKKKQEEIVELLSNKESLEEIYQDKISNFKINGQKSITEKNDIINGQNINNENVNENGEEHTNPNTNDSNNSNEENKNAENENDTHKKKESSTSSSSGSISSENNNPIEIKLNDIKISNQKKYEEQIISFTDEILQKNDNEFSLKLKKKVNLSYQAFFVETNSLENDAQTSIMNFFLRISEFISTQNVGIISEKTANLFIRELMRINSIDEEISEILKFLNKEYKDNKKDLKEKIKILNEKNDHLNIKKQTYETKKDDLKMFMEENKEKYNMEKNKINNEDDNKIQNVSFISEGNNNNNNHIMLAGCRSGFKKNSVKIKKINFDSINNSKNKLFFSDNNESNDLNISKDMAPNSDRQIIDNLNKYLINSLQINSKSKNKEKSIEKGNKKIVLHKNSFKNINRLNVNNLLNNNNEESNPQINESKINLVNNSEVIGGPQNTINKKRINMKIVYRNSKLNNQGKKTNSVVMHNSSNLQDLLSAQKKPNTNKIIFLKDNKSNSFKNINDLKSPSKITKTHRHNHIYFQREELKTELFSRSPDGNNNYRYISKTNGIPYQGKIIPLSKGNLDTKRIDISKIDKSNIYSTRYDNRLKILTQGIKESFCYFKFYKENHVEYNPIDELLKTPENLDYVEGYISIDVFLHKFKLIPKIYKNKKITYEKLVQNLSKEINITELDSCNDFDYCEYYKDFLGIELKDIIDVVLSKEMKEVIKIYNAYIKYAERQDKPDLNKFLNTREIRDIFLEQNDKIKAISCKYFIFSLKFKKESAPKIEFIFINYDQFNLWYNCLQYIIKINNQTPKLINLKTYGSPNKKKI